MNLVVAVDSKWGIGYKGDLLVRIRDDLRNFAALTGGKTVVLGSNTLATFPGGRVLKGRNNIVLNPDPAYRPDGATVAHSIPELLDIVSELDSDGVWVIGGMSVYRQLLPHCRLAFVTHVDADFEKDAFFPDLDSDPAWHMIFRGGDRESAPGDKLGALRDGRIPDKVNYYFSVYAADGSGK